MLGLVEMPRHDSTELTLEISRRRRELLRWIAAMDRRDLEAPAGLGILVRVVHDVAMGIREATFESGANVVVVEWPGLSSPRPRLLGSVLENLTAEPPADLLLVQPRSPDTELRTEALRILVPVRGGPNARLAVRVALALRDAWAGRVTLLHLVNPDHHPARRHQEASEVGDLGAGVEKDALEVVVRVSGDVGSAIVDAAAAYDVVVFGAYAERGQLPVLIRPDLAASLRALTGALILVRTRESLRSA